MTSCPTTWRSSDDLRLLKSFHPVYSSQPAYVSGTVIHNATKLSCHFLVFHTWLNRLGFRHYIWDWKDV